MHLFDDSWHSAFISYIILIFYFYLPERNFIPLSVTLWQLSTLSSSSCWQYLANKYKSLSDAIYAKLTLVKQGNLGKQSTITVCKWSHVVICSNSQIQNHVLVEKGNLEIEVEARTLNKECTPKKKSDGFVRSMLISVNINLQSLSSCTTFSIRLSTETKYLYYFKKVLQQ